MALKHDAQGFLAGDPIDIGRVLAVWDDIRGDVRAIRQAILGVERNPAVKAFQEVAQPMARDALSKSQQKNTVAALLRPKSTPPGRDNTSPSAKAAQNPDAHAKPISKKKGSDAVANPAGRDGRGRFVKSSAQPDVGKSDDRGATQDESALNGMADRIVSAVSGAGSGLEEADPAVKAFQEVAQPMARGFSMLSGGSGDKRKEGWFRRIYASLTGFRKDESIFNKAANKSLKNIEEKPEVGEGGGGLLGGLLPLLAKIPLIGPLLAGAVGAVGTLLSKIPVIGSLFKKAPVMGGLGGAATVGEAAGGAVGAANGAAGAGKGILGAGKGLLRKLPFIGALIAGVGAASDIYGSETDDTLSRRDKDKNAGKATGGLAGTLAGGFAGASAGAALGALGGPIGIAIGGLVGGALGIFLGDQAGQIIGDTMGGWVNDLRGADIPGKISSAWDSVIVGFKSVYESIGKAWGGFVDSAKSGWDTIANLFSSAYEGLKSIPLIGPAIQAVEDTAKKAAEAASAASSAVKQKAAEVSAKAVEKGKEAAQATKDKAVEVSGQAADAARKGVEYVANNTTVGKGVKAAVGAVNYGTDVAIDVAKSVKARVTGKASENKAALVNQMAASGITDPKEQAMFMAQMDHESGGFTKTEERFNYRSADRLMAVSGSARKLGKPAVEAAMAQGPEAVAEAMYGGRMGNKNPGDAYAFRGRGNVQLTGRDNYTSAGKELGLDLVKNPDLAAEPANAAKIAAWYWKKNNLGEAARQGDVLGVTKGINGGTNGLDDRASKYSEYLASANKGDLTDGTARPATASIATPAVQALAVSPAKYQQVQTAFAAAPVIPSFSSPPTIADAPPIINPLASSSDGRKAISVTMPTPDAGQDLKDRRIAHIVTGGFSA